MGRAVILASCALILVQIVAAQFVRKESAGKGPRALALVELAPNGKARLIPVTILFDGKFYDASAYKASPVPMALESGTVYEGERTGVSQGLFTVAGALQLKNTWMGEGTWRPAGAASTASRKASTAARAPDEDVDAPPKLRRPGAEPSKPAEPVTPAAQPQLTPQAPPAASAPAPSAAPASAPAPVPEDSDRPVLRRGKAEPTSGAQPQPSSKPAAKAASHGPTPAPAAVRTVQIFPAISDAGGPEPLPYTYDLRPEEEQQFRKKMLALAAEEVRARATRLSAATIEPSPPARTAPRSKVAAKPPQPSFEEVQLRVFDLSSSNQPVLVLEAKARMPQGPNPTGAELQYYVTLVARDDIYGELHKALANVSDSQHLDVAPRLELIDAVDADGDGRGELLFRQVSDAGSAFVVDRVIGDQVYTLFEGTPGE